MRILYHRCCGIDVHKKMIVACLLIVTAEASAQGDPDVQHHGIRSGPAPRVAQSSALRGCGDGEYRSLLEVHLERVRRGDGAEAVQCPTYQGRSRQENG
jgi:hypothetical protein